MSLQGSSGLIADDEAARRVRQAVDALDETIKDIRSAIFTLQSRPQPAATGLRARVVEVVEEMTGPLGFSPSVRLDQRLDTLVPDQIGEHVLAALRGPSNAARHSGCSRVSVTLEAARPCHCWSGSRSRDRHSSRRSGLGHLADRASDLGGRLRIEPATAAAPSLSGGSADRAGRRVSQRSSRAQSLLRISPVIRSG